MSKERHVPTNILLFQCSIRHITCRPTHALLLAASYICHISIVVQHSLFLHSWWHLAQQHTENAFLCFHCNNGYITHTLPVFVSHLKVASSLSQTLYCNLQTSNSVHRFYGMVLYTVFQTKVLSHRVSCCESYSQTSVLTHFVIFLLHARSHTNRKNGFKLQKFIHSSSLYVMVQWWHTTHAKISAQLHHTEKVSHENKQIVSW